MANIPVYQTREDKLAPEFLNMANSFVFDSLSDDYIHSLGLEDLHNVDFPFKPEDLIASKEKGLSVTTLADNMIVMLGVNPHFIYAEGYKRLLAVLFNETLPEVVCNEGKKALLKEQYHTAAVYFRAALVLEHDNKNAMFGYACTLRQWYLSLEGEDESEELVASLKAESTEYMEYCVLAYPDFDAAYYYLGYAYLNSAQYAKASFVWKKYLEVTENKGSEEYKEISERVEDLTEPVKIEAGINALTCGKYEEALKILEPYTESKYNNWWPLHFYLGTAYMELGHVPEAIEGFKRTAALNPSNVQAYEALAQLYEEAGETELAEKYKKKCEILQANL